MRVFWLPMKTRALLVAWLVVALVLPGIAQSSAGDQSEFVCSKESPQGSCVPPKLIHGPDPKYPRAARKDKIEGKVILEAIVGPDGVPSRVTVNQPLRDDLDRSAVDSVYGWTFSPATHDGKPVVAKVKIEVNFRLLRGVVDGPHKNR